MNCPYSVYFCVSLNHQQSDRSGYLNQEIDGQPSYAALQELPEPVDVVNVFRRCEYLPEIVDEAIFINAKTVWAQLGI